MKRIRVAALPATLSFGTKCGTWVTMACPDVDGPTFEADFIARDYMKRPSTCDVVSVHHSSRGDNPGFESDSSAGNNAELLQAIANGLLAPSVPLSKAAEQQLHHRSNRNHHLNGHSSICSCKSFTDSAASADSLGSSASLPGVAANEDAGPTLLKSLPTELLYDDAGLQLFDQITYLPEYYLTAAEADILASHGPQIVGQCVSDGTAVIELGAGSMRKTKLLLDAVVSSGKQDVNFFALDLCEHSLSEALGQLKDHFSGQIGLAGLVGTYQQGLAYIQQQQQLSYVFGTHSSTEGSTAADVAIISLDKSSAAAAEGQAAPNSKQLAPAGPEIDSSSSTSSGNSSDDDSVSDKVSIVNSAISGDTDDAAVIVADLTNDNDCCGNGKCVPICQLADNSSGSSSSGPGKLIMWLGSSIGNYSRENAASFLTQLRELAMQPGDLLLVGIDRRNEPRKVAEAYNDPAGITNAFIMNGLNHCRNVLDQQIVQPQNIGLGGKLLSSLNPEDFEYFCLYNDDLGRHEAYYMAKRDTKITFPCPASRSATTAGAASAPAAAAEGGVCSVGILAGELIHIEYSYKYSKQEVDELAAAAGMKWVKAWTDSKQQYDLHLLSRG